MEHTKTTIHLNDGSYRWIDVKHLPLGSDLCLTAEDALHALLHHPAYRDTYMSPDSETSEPVHGPYDLSRISISSFEAVTSAGAEALLQQWLALYGRLSADVIDGDLEGVMAQIRRAPAVFHLVLPESAEHEMGWVVGKTSGFLELVIINPGDVVLIVCSDD